MQKIQYPAENKFISDKNVMFAGASIAGIPHIYQGRTDHITWGFTAAATDASDLFLEEIQEGRYRMGEEYYVLEEIVYSINVKGKGDEEFIV